MDYTLVDHEQLHEEYLNKAFEDVIKWIYTNSGIEISSMTFEEYTNPRGRLSIRGKLEYRGPLQRKDNLSKIKLDLTCDERLVFLPEKRSVYHSYSDIETGSLMISCYCLEEIFSEKIRALGQRLIPRDLYDVINLYKDPRWSADKGKVLASLREKCDYKEVVLPTMKTLNASPAKQDLERDWNDMLAHQVRSLPSYEDYWSKLPEVFEWLYG